MPKIKTIFSRTKTPNPLTVVSLVFSLLSILLIIFIGLYLIGSGSLRDAKDRAYLQGYEKDIVVPPGCTKQNEKFSTDSAERFALTFYYTCTKTYTPDEINSYLSSEYAKNGFTYNYKYSSQNEAFKGTIGIDYYGNDSNINTDPTNAFTATITSVLN